MPAIHIVRDPSGQESVLDGQQRLRTIKAFIENDLRFSGKIDPRNEDLAAYDGKFYRDLPEAWQRKFQRFEITVVTLTDFEPAEPSELFFRLNQQYALTPPEKRNALFGHARDQVKKVVANLESVGLLRREVLGFSNGRLAYDDVISRVCIALQEGTLRRQLSNSYIEDFYRSGRFDDSVLRRALQAGEALGASLGGQRIMRFNKATLFTWFIFVDSLLRTTGSGPSLSFIRQFEELRSGAQTSEESLWSNSLDNQFLSIVQAYNDRASYRVLDVSSVLVRDFSLHLLYTALSSERPMRQDLRAAAEMFTNSQNADVDILELIDSMQWGYEL
ncbi:UNVERIFIED_CONTAM: hypothetical protein RKD43_004672 [Streptomyces graminofaciens]